METPSWRQILGGTAGVALLGVIGYFGQARIRTNSSPQKFVSSKSSSSKESAGAPTVAKKNHESNADRKEADSNVPPKAKAIKVDISGEIVKPGVYELTEGQRVEDLVKLAGGLKSNADRNGINFAMKLNDEAKVIVPSKVSLKTRPAVSYPPTAKRPPSGEPDAPDSESFEAYMKGVKPNTSKKPKSDTPSEQKPPPNVPVSINSATEIELQTVPGIGPSMAQRILDFRAKNGSFSRLEDLQKVKGMGGKTFEKIRQWIRL
jgi:competence protein ComEA